MFPPAIDIISTSSAVAYSEGKYTNKKLKHHHVTCSPTSSVFLPPLACHDAPLASISKIRSYTSLSVWIWPIFVHGGTTILLEYSRYGFMSFWTRFCVFCTPQSGTLQQVYMHAPGWEWSLSGVPSTLKPHLLYFNLGSLYFFVSLACSALGFYSF